MSATSNTAMWDALYAWVHSVLPSVEVTESHDNAPSPEGNFVCIDYAGTWRLSGTSASRSIYGRNDLPSPLVYVYRGSVTIRDVEGDGENLMRLVESLETQEVLSSFENAGISVLRTEGPNMLPALQQSQWRRESLLTLEMSWARAYSGNTLYIESVTIERQDKGVTMDEITIAT